MSATVTEMILTDESKKPEPAAADATREPVELDVPLPRVVTALSPEGVVKALETAAKRGKMPGFRAGGADGGLFEVEAFGQPFEGRVIARAERAGQETVLRFEARLRQKMVWIFAAILVLTIWPGVWFTESMLSTWFPGATWLWGTTYWWYLILTVPTSPWYLWSALRKSRRAVHASAHEAVASVAAAVQGRIEPDTRPAATG